MDAMSTPLEQFLHFGSYPITDLLGKMLDVAEVPKAEHAEYIDTVLKKIVTNALADVIATTAPEKREALLDSVAHTQSSTELLTELSTNTDVAQLGPIFTRSTQAVMQEFIDAIKATLTTPQQQTQFNALLKDYIATSLKSMSALK